MTGDHLVPIASLTGFGGLDADSDTGIVEAAARLRELGSSAVTDAIDNSDHEGRVLIADVDLLAPVKRPPKFLAIGLNYAEHIDETGRDKPAFPTFFNKQSTCVTGSGPASPIVLPAVSEMVDYEGELGLVIGRRCRNVATEDALSAVAGYLVVNDVSARDWQYKAPTWTLGKSFDTHGPIGPWLVTADEVPDPQDLRLRTTVNGDLRQDATTAAMITSCAEQISILSTVFTLEPGDVLATGTPSGVGMARTPPAFLVHGDVVRIEIDGVGAIENVATAERGA